MNSNTMDDRLKEMRKIFNHFLQEIKNKYGLKFLCVEVLRVYNSDGESELINFNCEGSNYSSYYFNSKYFETLKDILNEYPFLSEINCSKQTNPNKYVDFYISENNLKRFERYLKLKNLSISQ